MKRTLLFRHLFFLFSARIIDYTAAAVVTKQNNIILDSFIAVMRSTESSTYLTSKCNFYCWTFFFCWIHGEWMILFDTHGVVVGRFIFRLLVLISCHDWISTAFFFVKSKKQCRQPPTFHNGRKALFCSIERQPITRCLLYAQQPTGLTY